MTLAPRFAALRLPQPGATPAATSVVRHTLDLYLDYVCPFSAKLFKTFYTSVRPLIEDKYAAKLQVVFRPQIQPWHPSSTLVTEAAVAVLRLAPAQFWPFSQALFEQQTQFFDASVVNETRNQTYARLAKIAAGFGVEENAFLDLVRVADKPGPDGSLNGGNQVTNDVKVLVKTNRVVGVHVTPTVFLNGVEEKSISSSFTTAQWEEWLEKNIA